MRVIDHHDDLGELFLSSGLIDSCAGLLKEASWKEQTDLLDRDFALILVDGAYREHRKFACHDAGNTALSEFYLLNAAHGLDAAATKVAATNLIEAATAYGMEVHPLTTKLANAEGTPEVDGRRVMEKRANMGPASYTFGAGGGGGSTSALHSRATGANPISMASGGVVTTPTLALIGEDGPEAVVPLSKRGSKVRRLKEIVKKSSASPYDLLREISSSWDDLDDYDKHDVAVPLAKLASLQGMVLPDSIHKYAGESLNPNFAAIMRERKNFTTREDLQDSYDRLSKMASAMPLETVVEATHLIDEQAGLYARYGSRVPHPVLAVYGQEKQAEYSWTSGGDYVTERMLRRYSGSSACKSAMEGLFKESVLDAFRSDPLKTFKAMPREQQILVARMASQSRETNDGGY